ncbi:hypothetical protein SARC_02873 [Sphaeroforma arctica JP610]|uniref:RNA methyltransferase n=1 Tax=Sphaeroforma arctica JP610 TaxID=667725 RepID=A0A0L0G7M1_9EUKA|nr:hypothetical protein SARC_02873 [Sphaeroforma arctica JP610]KNC84919.1 hypothetical protein SARC_02873 [Sphaeroforma arctica JP610]|eukprot:XP_014158821.1 hypothetical protein SARC_02873 [Sphaeroforma arctica JP610]
MDKETNPTTVTMETTDSSASKPETSQSSMPGSTPIPRIEEDSKGKRAREDDGAPRDADKANVSKDVDRDTTITPIGMKSDAQTSGNMGDIARKRYKQSRSTHSNPNKQGTAQHRRKSTTQRQQLKTQAYALLQLQSQSYTGTVLEGREERLAHGESFDSTLRQMSEASMVGNATIEDGQPGNGGNHGSRHRRKSSNSQSHSRQNSNVGGGRGGHNNNDNNNNRNITNNTSQNSKGRLNSGHKHQNEPQSGSKSNFSRPTIHYCTGKGSNNEATDQRATATEPGRNKRRKRWRHSKTRTSASHGTQGDAGDTRAETGVNQDQEEQHANADNGDLMHASVETMSLKPSVTVDGGTKSIDGSRKDMRFRFGNYLHYYGYRTPQEEFDPRILAMQRRWFADKDVLDIGCNVGNVSLAIAQDFKAKSVVGIDIDETLIRRAKGNLKITESLRPTNTSHGTHTETTSAVTSTSALPTTFPMSFAMCLGPIPIVPPTHEDDTHSATEQEHIPEQPKRYPHNVEFRTLNVVGMEITEPEYDTVLCLSVVKWIHLNWGDEGVYTFFRNVLKLLRPGGLFVFEPQPWKSYKKNRYMHQDLQKMYQTLKFMPDTFLGYLTSEEGGFTHVDTAVVQQTAKQGFNRPIYILRKDNSTDKPQEREELRDKELRKRRELRDKEARERREERNKEH